MSLTTSALSAFTLEAQPAKKDRLDCYLRSLKDADCVVPDDFVVHGSNGLPLSSRPAPSRIRATVLFDSDIAPDTQPHKLTAARRGVTRQPSTFDQSTFTVVTPGAAHMPALKESGQPESVSGNRTKNSGREGHRKRLGHATKERFTVSCSEIIHGREKFC